MPLLGNRNGDYSRDACTWCGKRCGAWHVGTSRRTQLWSAWHCLALFGLLGTPRIPNQQCQHAAKTSTGSSSSSRKLPWSPSLTCVKWSPVHCVVKRDCYAKCVLLLTYSSRRQNATAPFSSSVLPQFQQCLQHCRRAGCRSGLYALPTLVIMVMTINTIA